MAILLDKQTVSGMSNSKAKKLADAIEQLSPDQQGALKLATTVTELQKDVDGMLTETTDKTDYPEFG